MSSWLPSPEQELLLQAALGTGEDVGRYWSEWRRRTDIEDLDLASFRLLPLAYLNLLEHGIDDPDLARLKGVYRQAWARSQLQQHGLEDVLRLLQDAGIETMLLKGSALIRRVYPNPVVRTMEDLDVLVRPDAARHALDALVAGGWSFSRDDGLPASRLRLVNAAHLRRELSEWINLDLHWLAVSNRYHLDEESFWSTAEPLQLSGVRTLVPSPTHMLLAVLVRAGQTPGSTTIRWVPDAVLTLRRLTVDWDRLVRECEQWRYTLSVAISLRYLQERFASVPPEAIERLDRVRAPRYERRELEARMRQTGMLSGLEFHRSKYRSVAGELPAWQRPARFPSYLRDWWGLSSTWSVPVEGTRRLYAKARARPPAARSRSQLDTAG